MKTGNAMIDGAALLDSVEGEGATERWVNMTLEGGGLVFLSPQLMFLAHDDEELPGEGVLYVSYAYGERRDVAKLALYLLQTERWHTVVFRRNLTRKNDRRHSYDAKRLVHLLNL